MQNEMNLKFIPNAIFRLPVIAGNPHRFRQIFFISYRGFVISGAWGRERETKLAEWLGSARLRSGELAWKIRVASAYPGLNEGLVRCAWSVRVIAITLET